MTANEYAVGMAIVVVLIAIWLDGQIPKNPRPPYGGVA